MVGDAGFGEGSGSLIFSQFQCSASDNKLIECPFDVITRDHCSNDAEISCIGTGCIYLHDVVNTCMCVHIYVHSMIIHTFMYIVCSSCIAVLF